MFCVKKTNLKCFKVLHCPAESKRDTQGAGYTALASLLEGFGKINCLPRKLKIASIDDGEGIEATLHSHKAKWHDLHRLEYNITQLRCAEKRGGNSPRNMRIMSEIYMAKL